MQIICLLLGIFACILVIIVKIISIIVNIIDDYKVKYLLRNGHTACIKYVRFDNKVERIFSKGEMYK